MTGKEIVKALRCCAKGLGHDDACENCKVGEIQDRREYIEFAAANVIERLTAENVALREKVYSMSGEWCAMMSVLNSLGSYDRLRELSEADKDGRVVVLPCKVGDKLYRVFAGEIFEHRVGSMKYFAIQGRWDIETYPFCPCVESSIGKTVFLTHEEAERALREIQGKEDADGTTDKPE